MNNYVFNNYIFANIKLPLEINSDGTVTSLHDYVNIHFSKCDQLPEKQNSRVNYDFLINNLTELMKQKQNVDQTSAKNDTDQDEPVNNIDSIVDEQIDALADEIDTTEQEPSATFDQNISDETKNQLILFVNQDELNTIKNERHNITFKNKRYNTNSANRFTAKRR